MDSCQHGVEYLVSIRGGKCIDDLRLLVSEEGLRLVELIAVANILNKLLRFIVPKKTFFK
jgi:hypothetical protein